MLKGFKQEYIKSSLDENFQSYRAGDVRPF